MVLDFAGVDPNVRALPAGSIPCHCTFGVPRVRSVAPRLCPAAWMETHRRQASGDHVFLATKYVPCLAAADDPRSCPTLDGRPGGG